MGIFVPLRQTTLHIPNTGPKGQGHLFIILTNKSLAGGQLLVPVCSQRQGFDATCILGVGDHDFINKPSFIEYANADVYQTEILIQRVVDGVMSYEGQLESTIFARVHAGLMTSTFTTPRIKNYHDEHYATPAPEEAK